MFATSAHRTGVESILQCYLLVLHIVAQVLFGGGNQGNHQNFVPSNPLTNFHGDEANKMFQKKSKIYNSKKPSFSKPPIFNIFSPKFQGLVLLYERSIDEKGIDYVQPIRYSGGQT